MAPFSSTYLWRGHCLFFLEPSSLLRLDALTILGDDLILLFNALSVVLAFARLGGFMLPSPCMLMAGLCLGMI